MKPKNKFNEAYPCCLNCVFLCKLRYSTYSELDNGTRKQLKSGDDEILKRLSFAEQARLSCYKAQLPTSQKHQPYIQGAITTELKDLGKKRCEFHFSYEGSEGLTLEGTEQKQARSMEIENAITAKRMLKISRTGLYISLLAVAISLFLGIIGLFL
ncbi:MAG: hypothetical protein FWF97_03110 [Alphaproteobacteria bacterium]|nr:hypothetical protein [Alphaproteobacteria bacterium]